MLDDAAQVGILADNTDLLGVHLPNHNDALFC